jgi:zinc protease
MKAEKNGNGIVSTRLENGLEVRLKEIHTAPLISHWVWYRVGSRNETPGTTGASHWVEHMMFKGTPGFPAGVLDRAISRDGGVWNAFTWLDWTAYLETMPAARIELGLKLESDRMMNSLFEADEVASERTVIISERQGHENEPTFRLSEEIQAATFRVHSYHHEVIGDMADLETMTREDLFQHYRRYYVPSNAVLAMAGDFEASSMLDLVQEYYGGLPAAPRPEFSPRPEPAQQGEKRILLQGPGETAHIEIGYHAPDANHPDFFPLSVLDSILTGASNLNFFGSGLSNKTSRLYRALVEGELAASIGGSLAATIDPFVYSLRSTVRPDKCFEDVLQKLDEELDRFLQKSVDPESLSKAIKQARALFSFGSESITNQAFWLGYSEMFADYAWFENYLDRIAAVSADQVLEVGRKYLTSSNRVVGIYQPTGEVSHG